MLRIFLFSAITIGLSNGFIPVESRWQVQFQSRQSYTLSTPSSSGDSFSWIQQGNVDDHDGTEIKAEKKSPKIHPKRERPRLPILKYEDSWVCINKPAGMTVHRSHRQSKFELVVSTTLKRQLRRKVWTVHRLDHRTSGALLFAFDAKTCARLHAALQSGSDNEKSYVALVRGNWNHLFDAPTVTIDQPVSVDGTKKDATTIFRCLSVLDHDGETLPCSLVQAQLKTGRRHQIRRHAYHMGMPVLGDTQHGDSRVNRWWRNHMGLDRLALHCLSLDLPWDGDRRIQIVAPLTQDLRSVLEQKKLAELWQAACDNEPRLETAFIDIRSGTSGPKKGWQKTKGESAS